MPGRSIFISTYSQYSFKSLRAQLVKGSDHLDRYPVAGNLAIMECQKRQWQEIGEVLGRFRQKNRLIPEDI